MIDVEKNVMSAERKIKELLHDERLEKLYEKIKSCMLLHRLMGVLTGRMMVFFSFLQLAIISGMVFLVEPQSKTVMLIHAGCMVIFSLMETGIVHSFTGLKKRFFCAVIFIASKIIFLSYFYKPYTYSIRMIISATILICALFCIIRKKNRWILVLLSAVGGILNSQFILFGVPLIIFFWLSWVYKKDDYSIQCAMQTIGVIVFVLILEGILLIFCDNIHSLPNQILIGQGKGKMSNVEILLLSYIGTYIVANVKKEKKLFGVTLAIAYFVLQFFQLYANLGYIFGFVKVVGMVAIYIAILKKGEKINVFSQYLKLFLSLLAFFIVVKLFASFRIWDVNWFSEYPFSHYYLTYQHFGLVQRGLPGSILYFLAGYYIPVKKLVFAGSLFCILCGIFLLVLLHKFIVAGKIEPEREIMLLFFTTYALSPAFGNFYLDITFLSYDVYNMLLCFLCVLLLIKNQNVWLVPVFCGLGMLNHHAFVFLAFPLVFIMLMYRAFVETEGHKIRNIIALIVSAIIICGLFIYFQFFSAYNLHIDSDTALELIEQRSGYGWEFMTIFDGVIFSGTKEHLETWAGTLTMSDYLGAMKSFIYFIPLFVFYFVAFQKSAQKEECKGVKIVYHIMSLAVFPVFICYLLETDYARWTGHLLTTLLVAPALLATIQKNEKKWYVGMDEHILKGWLLLILIMMIIYPDLNFSMCS